MKEPRCPSTDEWIKNCVAYIQWNIVCCAMPSHSLSCVRLFVTPWNVACQAPLSMRILQARILEWVAMPSSSGTSQPRDRAQVYHFAGGFFTVSFFPTREAHEGNLSHLQGIFSTQKLNWSLLHCSRILFQLSYWGSPQWNTTQP